MKKLLLLLCLFTIGAQLLHAQKVDSVTEVSQRKMFDHYWQKHENVLTPYKLDRNSS